MAVVNDVAFEFSFDPSQIETLWVNVGPRMTNTDSGPFMDITPSISIREVERGSQMGFGWSPHHHQPTDLYANLDDDDFRLGLNTEQTTLAALAELTAAKRKQ